MKRGLRYTLIGAAVVAVLLVLLVLVFTRTDFGIDQAGRLALDRVRNSINGELEVERITSGGLLSGVTLHGVDLTGPDGAPFVRADSARLTYRFRTLLGGSIVFDRLILYSPEVVIERLPGSDSWNYERIFPPDTAAPDTAAGGLVLIRDATVHDGRVVVRMPWEPERPVEPADTARLILERVASGLVRVMTFDALDARLPRIVWEAPEEETRLIEVEELSTRAYIWETPVEVERLEGVVTIRDSLLNFVVPVARLPDSRLSMVGEVVLNEEENRYDIQVDGEELSLADFQWLYPQLPADGGGSMQFRIQTQEPGSILWLARDARLSTSGTELAGSFGVITGDTLYFTGVDLEASPLDLDLIQRLVPSELPLEGLLIGTVEVEGPISSLETKGDMRFRTFREGDGAESTLRWSGGLVADGPVAARDLELYMHQLDLEQVAHFVPELRLRGRASGRVRASGSLQRGLQLDGELSLDREGRRSAVRGSGRVATAAEDAGIDLRFHAEPLALELLTEQFPELGRLAGEASGPVVVTGSPDDLRVEADLVTPAGKVVASGALALGGELPRYRAEGAVADFELHRVVAGLPETRVTARFRVQGQGQLREGPDGRGSVDVLEARVAGVGVGPSAVRGSVSDGLLRLDSLAVDTEVGRLVGTGTLGLTDGRSGELRLSVSADRLSRLEPVVFADPGPGGLLAIEPEPRLSGRLEADVVVTGSIESWAVRGAASGRDLIYDRLRLAAASTEFDWRPDTATVEVTVDSLFYGGRRVPHARTSVAWSRTGGRVVALARGIEEQRLEVEGAFERVGPELELRLPQLELATADGLWVTADTVRARVGLHGVLLDSLTLLRSPRTARIFATGFLPWRRPRTDGVLRPDLVMAFHDVPLGELLRVAQSDTTMGGIVTGRLSVGGTALAPVWEARVTARPFRYQGAVLDSAGVGLRYAGRRLRADFSGWQGPEDILSGSGTIPVDLALADRKRRWLDEPLDLRVRVDSVPAGLVAFLAPGFEELTGAVDGQLALVGTAVEPGLEGELRLIEGGAYFRPLNVRYERLNMTARMGAGRVVEIDARVATENGTGHVLGTVDVTRPTDPGLDLAVTARELDASRRNDIVAVMTGRARVSGRYTRPIVSGDVRILGGEMNLDEVWRQYQIVQLDPSLFRMFDSTDVSFRPPPEIPFLRNLVLTDATIAVERDFRLRSRELDVEVRGSLDVEADRRAQDLRITGSLEAVDGSYSLQLARGVPARTFDIRGGSMEFFGTPGIDPGLEIEAAYRVRRSQGDPIDVLAQVSGSLKDPRVQLTSDSDLPLSQSDLASYILFGRSGAELSQAESDVVSSGLGLVRPVATGLVSTTIQQALAGTGLPIDYIALTTPEYGLEQYQELGTVGMFHDTQLEVGIDAGRDLSLVGSVRLRPDGSVPAEGVAAWGMSAGARVEWRFRPTWTTELFVEDRFARTPSFGFTEIDDRKVWGLSLFRDWAY